MTLNDDKWQNIWRLTSLAIDQINESFKTLAEMIKILADKLRQIFSDIKDALKDILEVIKEERITCDKIHRHWRHYNYQPQPIKVNTKGYAPCHLPVTRRYI